MIVALAGRRIDEKSVKMARFPLEMKDAVYEKLLKFFREQHVTILVSSAACGADLLAQKAAQELNIDQHIILPFGRQKFRATSVVDRPGKWGKLFDDICDEVSRKGNLIILESFEKDEDSSYSAVTKELLIYAKTLRSNPDKILALAVGKGKAKDDSDETASFVRQAKAQGITVKEIETK